MTNHIIDALRNLEKENDIKILFAVESGSRGWGFPSADSDYDVRFLYLHKPEWYLSIEDKRDVLELPTDGVLDIGGWELRKAMRLLHKSNPTLLEWLQSPVIYLHQGEMAKQLWALVPQYFSPVHAMHHYFHTAKNKLPPEGGAEIKLKHYFYLLRPLLACLWIMEHNCCPPMEFKVLLDGARPRQAVMDEIQALLMRKSSATESTAERPNEVLMDYIHGMLAQIEPALHSLTQPMGRSAEPLNRLFRSSLQEYRKE